MNYFYNPPTTNHISLWVRPSYTYSMFYISYIFLMFLCEFFIILNLPAGVLLIPWLWFFALYCRNSNVQYQGPFKVRPWISERRQSFPILSQKRNWHNWSNNSSYTLYNPISCMIKSVQIENCNAMHKWWCGWIVSPILANYPGDPTVHKDYYVTQSQKKTASGVITRGYHCRFGAGWIFARSILANYPRELLPVSAPGLLCDVKSTGL